MSKLTDDVIYEEIKETNIVQKNLQNHKFLKATEVYNRMLKKLDNEVVDIIGLD